MVDARFVLQPRCKSELPNFILNSLFLHKKFLFFIKDIFERELFVNYIVIFLASHSGLEMGLNFLKIKPETYRGYETRAKSVWETRFI